MKLISPEWRNTWTRPKNKKYTEYLKRKWKIIPIECTNAFLEYENKFTLLLLLILLLLFLLKQRLTFVKSFGGKNFFFLILIPKKGSFSLFGRTHLQMWKQIFSFYTRGTWLKHLLKYPHKRLIKAGYKRNYNQKSEKKKPKQNKTKHSIPEILQATFK